MDSKKYTLFAVLKSFGVPAAIALAIVLTQSLSPWTISAQISKSIGSFFSIVFFLMYFYGQYKRVEKQTEDKESFKGVSEKLNSLEYLVRQLKTPINPEAEWTGSPISASAASLITEAKEILSEGHVLASLLQAGVAFEQALRTFSRRLDRKQNMVGPLHRIIQSLNGLLPKDVLHEFNSLREIRNKLVHLQEEEIRELGNAKAILQHYEWAIATLTSYLNDKETFYKISQLQEGGLYSYEPQEEVYSKFAITTPSDPYKETRDNFTETK
jgi:uncharacterized protein YutE (UPF0331/DUF86 family)